jgi:ferredoxin-NADP reductase
MNELAVHRVQWLSPDIFELSLERQGLNFTPGDCVAIHQADVSRPYSIASGSTENLLRFVIRRIPGGAVTKPLSGVHPGQRIRVSAPFGWFRPARGGAPGAPSVFIATGTGVAPFLSALRSYPSEIPSDFLLGVRHLEDAVSLPFLQARGGVRLALSGHRAPVHHHGRVTTLLHRLGREPDTHFYLCGLDAMIDEVTAWLERHEVAPTHIHREVFFHA